MKKLKQFIFALSLLAVCYVAKATPDEGIYTKTHAINTYIDAMSRGKFAGFADVLDPSAKFNMLQGKRIMSYDKKDMLDFLQKVKNIEEDCTVNTSIVESNVNITVVKVDMKFSTFVRSNYVSIANTGNGWKIINVYSVFN
jgi:hypothetical protein